MTGAGARRPIRVVVVTFNSADVIEGLLATLDRGMKGCEWDLVVVDNASVDETTELVRRRCPRAEVIEMATNAGFAAAVNRGIGSWPPAYDVLILNPDVRLGCRIADRLQARLGPAGRAGEIRDATDAHGRIGVVAPVLVDRDGAVAPSLRREPTVRRVLAEALLGVRRAGLRGWGEAVLDPAAYERPTVAEWASGAALMVSAPCLSASGAWDESLFLYSEDTEYSLRARDRGYLTCLEPAAVVTHLGGASRRNQELWALLVSNKLALYERRHGRIRAIGFRIALLLRELRLGIWGNRPSWAAALALVTTGGRNAR